MGRNRETEKGWREGGRNKMEGGKVGGKEQGKGLDVSFLFALSLVLGKMWALPNLLSCLLKSPQSLCFVTMLCVMRPTHRLLFVVVYNQVKTK